MKKYNYEKGLIIVDKFGSGKTNLLNRIAKETGNSMIIKLNTCTKAAIKILIKDKNKTGTVIIDDFVLTEQNLDKFSLIWKLLKNERACFIAIDDRYCASEEKIMMLWDFSKKYDIPFILGVKTAEVYLRELKQVITGV